VVTPLKGCVGASGPTGGDDGLGGYMPLAIAVGTTGTLNWVHANHNGTPLLLTNTTGVEATYGDHAVLGFPGQFANAKLLAGSSKQLKPETKHLATTKKHQPAQSARFDRHTEIVT
jgi:hypothetical protein